MSNYTELKDRADELFALENYPDALLKYKEAREATSDPMAIDYCDTQIGACAPRGVARPEGAAGVPATKKKGMKNPFKFNIGQELIQMAAKKFLPKLKPMIMKNKPKAISFMKGEIGLKGEPTEGEPVRRRILIEYREDPNGNPELDDVLVQILRADRSKVQIARDKEGNSVAHEQVYSVTEFIDTILNTNLEEVAKEMQKEAKDKKWLD